MLAVSVTELLATYKFEIIHGVQDRYGNPEYLVRHIETGNWGWYDYGHIDGIQTVSLKRSTEFQMWRDVSRMRRKKAHRVYVARNPQPKTEENKSMECCPDNAPTPCAPAYSTQYISAPKGLNKIASTKIQCYSLSDALVTWNSIYSTPSNANGETAMTANNPETATQRQHLLSRLYNIKDEKDTEARKHFGLYDDGFPTTVEGFIKRIVEGRITVRDEDKKRRVYDAYDATTYIRFRDPAKKEDTEGFEKFCETLNKEYSNTVDSIKIEAPEAGLKALRAFEAKTFH